MINIRWTSADASRLFLCAFAVTVPVATTLKYKESDRKRKLEEDMSKFLQDVDLALMNSGQNNAA